MKARLILLSMFLGGLLVVAGVLYGPQLLQERKLSATTDRLTISSTLKRVAMKQYKQSGKWPEDLTAMAQDQEIKALNLGGDVAFKLLRKKGNDAYYELSLAGKKREVFAPGKSDYDGPPPTVSGASAAGG